MLWKSLQLRTNKLKFLIHISPILLSYTQDRMLMSWHYPNGISGKRTEKRSVPDNAPQWLSHVFYKGKNRILLNDSPTLVWLAQFGALEFHIPFDKYNYTNYPTELAFDLDPADDTYFLISL